MRRMAVALALVGVGAGGLAAAAWLGLVPGVQLRQRLAPTPGASAADDEPRRTGTLPGDRPGEVAPPGEPAADSAPAPLTALADDERVAPSAADVAIGDAVYHGPGRCASCHGSAGEGVTGLGPSLRDGEWLHGSTRAAIRQVTAEGTALPLGGFSVAMPAYGAQLGPEQIAQVAAYVWALSRPTEVRPEVRPDSGAIRPTVPMVAPGGPPAPSSAPAPRPTVPFP